MERRAVRTAHLGGRRLRGLAQDQGGRRAPTSGDHHLQRRLSEPVRVASTGKVSEGFGRLRAGEGVALDELTTEGLKVAKESRAFRVYEASGVPLHSHQVPTVMILVNGDHPGQATLIPAGKEHQIAAQADVRVVEIEVR